jgi:enoyl-CoA hydratase/carnithine racemase
MRSELRDGVAIAHLDDGKANAFSHEVISALGEHLDRFGAEGAESGVKAPCSWVAPVCCPGASI